MNIFKKILLLIFTLILLATAGGMFYIQNIYLPEQEAMQQIEIYTAKEDIDPLTVISEEMFEKKIIPKKAYVSEYVLSFEEVKNYQAKSTIYKGEPLVKSNLTEEKINPKENLMTTIVPNYWDNIEKGDLINVYVLKSKTTVDEETEEEIEVFSVENVFLAKKVERITSEETARSTNAGKSVGFSVLVDEKELKRYYAADYSGEILTVKISNPNIMNLVSSLTEFDPNKIIFKTDEPLPENDEDQNIGEIKE